MPNANYEYTHAPGAKLDYSFDWSLWLDEGDSIVGSSWSTTTDLTLSQPQILANVTSTYVAGGTIGKVCKITNAIITALGKEDSRSITLSCKQR